MTNQKLIMENWRRFLNEEKLSMTLEELRNKINQMPLREDVQLDEGFVSKLAMIGGLLGALMSSSTAEAGQFKGIELQGKDGAEYQLSFDDIKKVKGELEQMSKKVQGDKDMERAVELGALNFTNSLQAINQNLNDYGENVDKDGDGFAGDSLVTGPLTIKADALEIAIQNVKDTSPSSSPDAGADSSSKSPSALDIMKMQRKANPDAPQKMKDAHQDLVKKKNW